MRELNQSEVGAVSGGFFCFFNLFSCFANLFKPVSCFAVPSYCAPKAMTPAPTPPAPTPPAGQGDSPMPPHA